MEDQIARHLYDTQAAQRPALAGKQDLRGAALLPSVGELTVGAVRDAIKILLDQLGIQDAGVDARHAKFSALHAKALTRRRRRGAPGVFLLGLPAQHQHENSRRLTGHGRHRLPRPGRSGDGPQHHAVPSHGPRGFGWNGASQFVDMPHVFQNMGDGTYSHSGILAIRAAVAAGATITYKVLYNDAVAMTGGQPVELHITPVDMVRQLLSEGVRPVHLVSDAPGEVRRHSRLPQHASVLSPRRAWTACNASCARSPGVTAIVYEQTCAAEKRRRRKRGLAEEPRAARVHQPGGVRRLRRLLGAIQLHQRSCRWKPNSGASAGSTSPPATRITVA
jgi:indolepyruvate ferredoxin oxidoreductase